jgi:outer membrane biosynthesis protein TonB
VVAQPEQSSSIKIEPTRATVATVKPTKPGRRPPRGARVTQRRGGAAAAAGQGAGAEGDPSLSRFSDTSGRPLNLQPGGGGGARGTPAQSDITRVISNNKAGIKICYQRALLRDSSLTHGKINVRVSIGLSGRAKSVNVDGPPAFRALEPCIREVLSRWAFPPSSEEYGTEFSYVFQGNE